MAIRGDQAAHNGLEIGLALRNSCIIHPLLHERQYFLLGHLRQNRKSKLATRLCHDAGWLFHLYYHLGTERIPCCHYVDSNGALLLPTTPSCSNYQIVVSIGSCLHALPITRCSLQWTHIEGVGLHSQPSSPVRNLSGHPRPLLAGTRTNLRDALMCMSLFRESLLFSSSQCYVRRVFTLHFTCQPNVPPTCVP
jgi:hypothetical protein